MNNLGDFFHLVLLFLPNASDNRTPNEVREPVVGAKVAAQLL
jgi:hypothetical protein